MLDSLVKEPSYSIDTMLRYIEAYMVRLAVVEYDMDGTLVPSLQVLSGRSSI